jgi:DNA-binding beta-propeller fold protein YncE
MYFTTVTTSSWFGRLRPRSVRSPRIPGPSANPATAPRLPGISTFFTALPARPFDVAVSAGGGHAFVSMPRPGQRGLLVLSAGAPWSLERVLWFADSLVPRGLVTDHASRYLLIANGTGGLLVADTARLIAGTDDPFAAVLDAPATGSMQVALDREERFAFVTDEDTATLSVFDFGSSLSSPRPAAGLVGQVPMPPGPVGVACSVDGRHLFVTSQAKDTRGGNGVLSVLRAADAVEDPQRARVVSVPAGSSPVRVAASPRADVVWVTARGSNSVLAFDLERLIAGSARPLRAVVRVGSAPVGLALLDRGSTVVVANSNRYGRDAEQPQTLSVIDADAALEGRKALVGSVPAGAFPRELARLPDDRSVLVTNVFSQSLQAVSVLR